MNNNFISHIDKFATDHNKAENGIFEKCLLLVAEPPIKGTITKGKLKWRGIKLVCTEPSVEPSERWLEQRGKQISPKISMGVPQL
jgi:hypothetical protein